jgi:hypothetical protein
MKRRDEEISSKAWRSSAVMSRKDNDPCCPQTLKPLHRRIDGVELLEVVNDGPLLAKSLKSGHCLAQCNARRDQCRNTSQDFAKVFHIAFGYFCTSDADLSM